mmetsp:Transcript_86632/g.245143  ORF Transcript_86632/g.245143 Transcript_86632/m.245143 type:complete len:161 (+) Transcript_86632:3217-3699(+)
MASSPSSSVPGGKPITMILFSFFLALPMAQALVARGESKRAVRSGCVAIAVGDSSAVEENGGSNLKTGLENNRRCRKPVHFFVGPDARFLNNHKTGHDGGQHLALDRARGRGLALGGVCVYQLLVVRTWPEGGPAAAARGAEGGDGDRHAARRFRRQRLF